MSDKSVAFFISHDSYLHVSCNLAPLFIRDGYDVKFILVSEELSGAIGGSLVREIEISNLELDELSFKYISQLNCQILIAAVPPSILKAVSNVLHDCGQEYGSRPRLVTFFPGMLQEKRAEGMYERSYVDTLLLNSEYDYRVYQSAGRELGFETNNALVLGFLGRDSNIDGPCCDLSINAEEDKHILFIEQQIMPNKLEDRVVLLEKLIDLAHRSDCNVVIKLRSNSGQSSSVSGYAYHFEDIFNFYKSKKLIPVNLKLSSLPIEEVIRNSSLCISVSSTVIFKSIAAGVPVAILSDFGIKDHYGNVHFVGSGCFVKLSAINGNYRKLPDLNWTHDRMSFFNSIERSLSEEILKFKMGGLVNPFKISENKAQLVNVANVKYFLVLNKIKLLFLRFLWNR